MNFTVNRTEMAKALKTALKIATNARINQAMSGVLIEANAEKGIITATAVDACSRIQYRLKCEHIQEVGAAVFPDVVSQALLLLDGETVEISANTVGNNTVDISAGGCSYNLSLYKIEEFPKIKVQYPDKFVHIKGANSLISHSVFAAVDISENKATHGMQCVKLSFGGGDAMAEATNGTIIARAVTPHATDGNLEVVVYESALDKLVQVINASDDLYIGVKDKFVYFMTENVIFTTLRYTGETLDLEKVFERIVPAYGATADASDLFNLVSGAIAVLSDNDDRCVNLVISDGKIAIKTKTALSAASTSIPATDTVSTPEDGFNYNPKWLLDCFRRASGPTKITTDKRGFMLIEANHNRYCVMPRGPVVIRVKEAKPKKKAKVKAAA